MLSSRLYDTSDLWIYWLCVCVTLNIVSLLLFPCMSSKQSWVQFPRATCSLKIEAIFILSKLLMGCWFWVQQLAGKLEKLRFDKFSVQVCYATIIFDFVGVCPEGAILKY